MVLGQKGCSAAVSTAQYDRKHVAFLFLYRCLLRPLRYLLQYRRLDLAWEKLVSPKCLSLSQIRTRGGADQLVLSSGPPKFLRQTFLGPCATGLVLFSQWNERNDPELLDTDTC